MQTKMNEQADPPRYAYLEQADKDGMCPIMIMEGPFEGFVFQYGVVSVEEIEEDDGAKLTFDYELVEVPSSYVVPENEEEEKEIFEGVVGDVLVSIIVSSLEEVDGHSIQTLEEYNDRETDSGELDS